MIASSGQSCEHLECEICHKTPLGPKCSCKPGFKIGKANHCEGMNL